jgi:hypothetical protein
MKRKSWKDIAQKISAKTGRPTDERGLRRQYSLRRSTFLAEEIDRRLRKKDTAPPRKRQSGPGR